MGIKIFNEETETTRYLMDIENNIKQLISKKTRNKQIVFNELVNELRPFYTGFKVAFFMGLLKESKQEKNLLLDGGFNSVINNTDRFRVYRFLRDCVHLEQQNKGFEIVFKDTHTEINPIKNKVLRWS